MSENDEDKTLSFPNVLGLSLTVFIKFLITAKLQLCFKISESCGVKGKEQNKCVTVTSVGGRSSAVSLTGTPQINRLDHEG